MALLTSLLTGIGPGGTISGPGSSTDNAAARWNGVGGTTLQDSSVIIDDSNNITGVNDLTVDNDTILGDPGTEGSGITVGGVTYDSVAKVSDLGGTNQAQFILHRHSTTLAPLIVGARSNSNDSTHSIVTDGMPLFQIYGVGWDGSDYEIAGSISLEVDGTPGSNDMPGRWVFNVTPDGSATPAEAFRISQDKTITVDSLTASRRVTTNASKVLTSDDIEIYATGTLSNANLTGMYASPVQLLAAPGANQAIIIHRFFLQHEFSSAAFTGGGAIIAQYSNAANGTGTHAVDQVAASLLTTGANTGQMQNGQLPASAQTVYDNVGIFISNEDAAFATGDGTAIYRIWYSIIAV